MLRGLNKDQAHFIALLARVARMQRDNLLGNVAEKDLGGASRHEHNPPTALLGFEPLPPEAEQLTALREAISSLTPNGRAELYTLMRLGQGDLAAHSGIADLTRPRCSASWPLAPFWTIRTCTITWSKACTRSKKGDHRERGTWLPIQGGAWPRRRAP